jgi:anti-sigma factor RsiW
MERGMKCSQIKKFISPYMDGELGPEEKKVFESHVVDCLACRKELEDMQSIHQSIASKARLEAPAGFVTRVMAQIEEGESRSSFWGFFTLQPLFIRVAEVAFALVFLLIGAFSGNLLTTNRTAERVSTTQESFSFDVFQAAPPGSVGDAYMTLTGVSIEK